MDNYMSCDSSTRSSARPEDCKLMRAAMAALIVCTITALLLLGVADAADPDPLQDFCVADLSPNAKVHVNGFPCKDRANVTSKDFLYTGMRLPGNVSLTGTNAVPKVVNVFLYPALNTLGISHARLDFVTFNSLNSQNPGFVTAANQLLFTNISAPVLESSLGINAETLKLLQDSNIPLFFGGSKGSS
ncbi:unnamed protein product [Sphagnum tenellum]